MIEERTAPAGVCSPTTGCRSPTCSPASAPTLVTMSRVGSRAARPDPRAVRLVPRPRRLHARLRPHHRRDRQGAVPGPAAGQARHRPRVHRGWAFAVQRAATNGVLRDLNTALVAEEMRARRAEHLRRLRRLRRDRPPRRHLPARVAGRARGARPGPGVLARSPRTLPAATASWCCPTTVSRRARCSPTATARPRRPVCGLMNEHVQTVDAPSRGSAARSRWPATSKGGLTGKLAGAGRPAHRGQGRGSGPTTAEEPVIVLGSGNLGLIYLRGDRRWTLEELDGEWPALSGAWRAPRRRVRRRRRRGRAAWAIGAEGGQPRDRGGGGHRPARPFAAHAARVLPRADARRHPTSTSTARRPRHAGRRRLRTPRGLPRRARRLAGPRHAPGTGGPEPRLPERIEGADQLHRVLVGMLEASGQRATTASRG